MFMGIIFINLERRNYVMSIPISIYILIISLMGLILLSIFNKKLNLSTVTISEYIIGITSIMGIFMLFIEYTA